MNTIQQKNNQKICDVIIQVQTDLEELLKQIFAQAGSKISSEKREEFANKIADTKQLLERFKSSYA